MDKKTLVYGVAIVALIAIGGFYYMNQSSVPSMVDEETGLRYLTDENGQVKSSGFESFKEGVNGYTIGVIDDKEFIIDPAGQVVSLAFEEIEVQGNGYIGTTEGGGEYELNEFGAPSVLIPEAQQSYEDVVAESEGLMGDLEGVVDETVDTEVGTDTDVEAEAEVDAEAGIDTEVEADATTE
ncbi:MAG: hypothetical protein COT88_00425 [Candidatus Colwellbacteria bacterium CG10_big_fil_rev_8_21_14_0_10_41_28]|uniref:Uncharacterized protein n=1 Tax=Candidatus Colwellbacteria bacterium CG10_big_fil_rev_8_21_14_0_10_41_28 TaxID=1974539 RepID=A0A2H0VJY5_9BACT|nr:MAG: hypothetical protein COT88_00425 [Candidatus Colwellbacteria bacterium CG10_big_fil_rev_8_21_14_0_10_41_28]